jgi:HEAT repeat protein
VANIIAPALNQTYLDFPEDRSNGQAILDLLKEVQDARALPALKKALEWRTGVTELHAVRAAQAIGSMTIPDSEKSAVATALGTAFDQITGVREVDNQMRVEFVRALGALQHNAATPVLVRIMQNQSENQHFLINRLAARALGELGDPMAVEPMIGALFQFAPNAPAMRMNDVAAEALVRIGRPSLAPMLQVLAGQHAAANTAADALIAAVQARQPGLTLNRAQVVGPEATTTLGMLGFADAFDPLLAETRAEEVDRKLNGCIALTRLTLSDAQHTQVRTVITELYNSFSARQVEMKAQLLATMANTFDPGYLPLFLTTARDSDLHPVLRETAISSLAKLANAAQTTELRAVIAADSDNATRYNEHVGAYLTLATECDTNVSCYVGKLTDTDDKVAEKAAYMIGLLASDNDEAAMNGLAAQLGHATFTVRFAALLALDHIATSGSQAGIDKIEELRTQEDGRAIWMQFKGIALPIQARLRARMPS